MRATQTSQVHKKLHISVLAAVFTVGCVGASTERRGGPSAAYDGPVVQATSEQMLLTGRFQKTEDGVRAAWSGATVTLHFRGSAASVDLTEHGDNHYLVLVDGKPKRERIAPVRGRSVVELVRGLPRGEHTVSLYKLTEPLVGDVTVHAFVLDQSGEALPPPPAPTRHLLLIGDSISAGYGNEDTDPLHGFSPETENHYLTYGARAARELGASLTTIAWSGKGVFSNRGNRAQTMNELWKTTLPNQSEVATPPDSPAPEVVLINLGTNDFAPEELEVQPFGLAYEKLLTDVRSTYKEAHIVVCVGPLLTDDYPEGKRALTTVRAVLGEIVEERRASGDERIHYLEFPHAPPAEGLGADYHPSVATHLRMAGELVGFIRKVAAW